MPKPTSYSAEFESFWIAYPDRTNNSKTRAYLEWCKFSPEEQALAVRGLGGFSAYCKAHPDYTCIHAERYLSQRRFEGFASSAGTTSGTAWWLDDAKVARVNDQQWRNSIQKHANGTWPVEKLSPPPGHPGCRVPKHIIVEDNLTEKYSPEGLKRRETS